MSLQTPENLAILILSYNSSARIIEQVSSLLREGADRELFWLIDNNSQDVETLALFSKKESLRLLKRTQNDGYALGNNEALHAAVAAGKKYFLILNPDIEISLKSIQELYTTLVNKDDLLIIGPRICDKFKRDIIFSDGGLLLEGESLRGDHVNCERQVSAVNMPALNYAIDYVNGSALMFKEEVLRINGWMREDFFMYYEESEWCYRMKLALGTGKQAILTTTTAYHEMSVQNNFFHYYMTRNRIWFCRLYQISYDHYVRQILFKGFRRLFHFKNSPKKNFSYFKTQIRAVRAGVSRKF